MMNNRFRSKMAFGAALGCFLVGAAGSAQEVGGLRAENAPPGGVWMDSFDLSLMTRGWGTPQARRSVEGKPLTLHGAPFSHGVGTHAESDFSVQVNDATRFECLAGVDDEEGQLGSVRFLIYGDGKRLADSGILKGGDDPKPLSVDLRGVKILTLHVDGGDDGINNDHADWAGAVFLVAPGGKAPVAIQAVLPSGPPLPIAPSSLPSPLPAIHGARVVGATPGRPFFFKIPATGREPLAYSAKGLPAGLKLNPRTGLITGSLTQAATTFVRLKVSNAVGQTRRGLVIVSGEHKLAQTPPMGWNTWNAYHGDVEADKMRAAVQGLLSTGLDRHGYAYVNVDDAWQGKRDAQGNILPNDRFKDIKALSDDIHADGFKFGIYSSPGPTTCAGYEGSYKHEEQDARTYASWGVDYLKYDWCSYGQIAKGHEREDYKLPYRVMRTALDKAPRDIVYSLCQYGMGDVRSWGNDPDIGGNLWRTTDDIGGSYGSMANIGFSQSPGAGAAGPGHWNDPDMLWLHSLRPNEQITHLTLWSLLAAPLLIGSDLRTLDRYSLDALSNDEMIDVDQDPLGRQATRHAQDGLTEVWARPLWDGTLAVGLFNRNQEPLEVAAHWKDLGLSGAQPVRDLWLRRDLGTMSDGFKATIPGHGAMLLKVGKPKTGDYRP